MQRAVRVSNYMRNGVDTIVKECLIVNLGPNLQNPSIKNTPL